MGAIDLTLDAAMRRYELARDRFSDFVREAWTGKVSQGIDDANATALRLLDAANLEFFRVQLAYPNRLAERAGLPPYIDGEEVTLTCDHPPSSGTVRHVFHTAEGEWWILVMAIHTYGGARMIGSQGKRWVRSCDVQRRRSVR